MRSRAGQVAGGEVLGRCCEHMVMQRVAACSTYYSAGSSTSTSPFYPSPMQMIRWGNVMSRSGAGTYYIGWAGGRRDTVVCWKWVCMRIAVWHIEWAQLVVRFRCAVAAICDPVGLPASRKHSQHPFHYQQRKSLSTTISHAACDMWPLRLHDAGEVCC